MKRTAALVAIGLTVVASLPVPCSGQPTQSTSPSAVPPTGSMPSSALEDLLGPIALYPDELLANVLAASVYPDEVKEAANLVRSGADKKTIDARDWEPPVKAVAKIPDVIKMMGEYQDWTTSLGQAYLTQSQDVMKAIQSLRKKANANGALQTTPQQKVVVEQETIYIQSADPEVIYVPSYQPSVVYVDDDSDELAAGLIGFGTGIAVGAIWAGVACDWNHGCVGWGNDIDINRNVNVGDVNIGNSVGSGNRVNPYSGRVGQEGNAWSPNRNKALATSRPSQGTGSLAGATPRPTSSSAARAPAATSARQNPRPATASPRPSTGRQPATSSPARSQAPSSARPPSATRTPAIPTQDRAQSAYRGGADTRASSSRGSSSRSYSQGGGGSRSSASRGGGGSRSSGGSRGGGRGGGGGRR